MMPSKTRKSILVSVAGSAGLDITLREPPSDWIGKIARDVYTQQTLLPLKSPVEMGLGGNGASASYVLAKMGLQVQLNAPIGTDPAGIFVQNWLKKAGVQCITPAGQSTMHAITAVDKNGQRLGTLQHVGPSIDWGLSNQNNKSQWLLVSLPGQITIEEFLPVKQLLESFSKSNRTRVLDTGIGWIKKILPKEMIDLWSHAEIISGTIEELKYWTDCQTPHSVIQKIMTAGPHTVVLKMGAKGVAYQSRKQPFDTQLPRELSQNNVSIGAGDAFNGALIAELIHGRSVSESVANAQRIATQLVENGKGVLGWGESAI